MTENLAGRGEGLKELVAKWREVAKEIQRIYAHPQDYSETKQEGRGEAIGECATELEAALEAAAPAGTASKSFYDHVPPDRAAIEKNKAEEPHGERLRAELEDWLDRNGIVSMRLDTQNHCVSVDIAKLPPEIKSVLRLWGSIYVERAALATRFFNTSRCRRDGRNRQRTIQCGPRFLMSRDVSAFQCSTRPHSTTAALTIP